MILNDAMIDIVMKALAYCAINSKGRFAYLCKQAWESHRRAAP